MIWLGSQHKVLRYMKVEGYTQLNFDFICSSNNLIQEYSSAQIHCKPDSQFNGVTDYSGISTSSILANIFSNGNLFEEIEPKELTNLLSSVLMNGLPIMGLHDFILLSDFINKNLGVSGRKRILDYQAYNERFGNLLDIRKKELRIVPKSCITEMFANYLRVSIHPHVSFYLHLIIDSSNLAMYT